MALSGLLAELQTEGVLRLYHDYRSGRVYDFSGNGNHGVVSTGTASWTKKGLSPFPLSKKITVPASPSTLITSGTFVALGEFESETDFEHFISKNESLSHSYTFAIRATGAFFQDAASVRDSNVSCLGKRCVACSFSSGSVVSFYNNGLFVGNSATACSVSSFNTQLYIATWRSVGTPHTLNSLLKAVIIISRPLTATEHSVLFSELENRIWPTKGLFPGAFMP